MSKSLSQLGLAGSLLLASPMAEAGIGPANGTIERQNGGDCSGYTNMTRLMIQGSVKGTLVDAFSDDIQKQAIWKLGDGNSVVVYQYGHQFGDEITAVLVPSNDWKPRDSAYWSPDQPGSPKCAQAVHDFKQTPATPRA